VYTDREDSPDPRAAAECAAAAGVLGPLVAVLASANLGAVEEAAHALENITLEVNPALCALNPVSSTSTKRKP
jgi:hypothetical protein